MSSPYVFDTNSFSVLKNYYPDLFPSLWKLVDELVDAGTIVSVAEVLNELQNDNRDESVIEWAKDHRAVFAKPSDDELVVVQRILAVGHFQAVITRKALLKGTPVADPFIVASASVSGGTVITEEAKKPNAAKVPNICETFEVPCENLKWFMQQQGWTF